MSADRALLDTNILIHALDPISSFYPTPSIAMISSPFPSLK
jgi:hypothetical protein